MNDSTVNDTPRMKAAYQLWLTGWNTAAETIYKTGCDLETELSDTKSQLAVIVVQDRINQTRLAETKEELSRALGVLEKCETALRETIKNNGGPISAEDTVDGKDYVMVQLADFNRATEAISELDNWKKEQTI